MIDDKLVLFKEQAVSNASKLAVLDFGAIDQPGQGSPLYLNIYVDTAFTGATTGTGSGLQIDLCTSSASGCSADVLETIVPFANTDGTIWGSTGLIYRQALPAEKLDTFVGLAANLSGAIASGKITAYLDTK